MTILLQLLMVLCCYVSFNHVHGSHVLNDIINVLAANPRTRSLFLRTVSANRLQQRLQRQQEGYLYAIAPQPSLISRPPSIASEGSSQTLGPPYTTNHMVPCNPQVNKCPVHAKAGEGSSDVEGVGLDVNGDMKQNIPYKFGATSTTSTTNPDALFQKKRKIIRELRSLFRVVLDGDVSNVRVDKLQRRRMLKTRGHPLQTQHELPADATRGNMMGNESVELRGAKRERITVATPGRQNGSKRVMLYRKLINDLNDLITLEINKNNKTNTFEGVENLAPSKLRRNLPKPSKSVVKD